MPIFFAGNTIPGTVVWHDADPPEGLVLEDQRWGPVGSQIITSPTKTRNVYATIILHNSAWRTHNQLAQALQTLDGWAYQLSGDLQIVTDLLSPIYRNCIFFGASPERDKRISGPKIDYPGTGTGSPDTWWQRVHLVWRQTHI